MTSATSRHDVAAAAATAEQGAESAQAIEYIEDLIYLASFSSPPTSRTPFPYIKKKVVYCPPSKSGSKTPRKPMQKTVLVGPRKHPPIYFNIKDTLLYNPFYHDFGPLHIGHLYRFAVMLHEVLGDPANKGHGVVIWTLMDDSRGRANAACMLACYMVLIQHWPPHLALAPLVQMDPPCMPFRDAGYSQADYILTVQDIVYGVWKAKEEAICCLKDFCLEEYETFERVDMGDFNWVTPNFLAFASPQYPTSQQHHQSSSTQQNSKSPSSALLPPARTIEEVLQSDLPIPFKNVLVHFKIRNVGLVVRLNSELYPAEHFSALGMEHLDMIFPDGTCPSLELVRQFVNLAHEVITVRQQNIAVHCKAGLGRTGCLIGAYLIYRHGFTANEIIAFMRFMRPGMVVGPQQHWLHINQGVFREWWFEDSMRERMAAANAAAQTNGVTVVQSQPATPSRPMQKLRRNASSQLQLSTPPNNGSAVNSRSSSNNNNKRSALGEIHANDQGHPSPHHQLTTNNNNNNNNSNSAVNTPLAKTGSITTVGGTVSTTANDENLPAPTPGQPRKTVRQNTPSHHSPQRQQRLSSLSTYNHHNYNPNPSRTRASTSTPTDKEAEAEAEAEVEAADREPVTLQGRMHRRESETDEDFYLRLLSRRGASTTKTSGGTDVAGLTGTSRRRTSSRTMGTTATAAGAGTGTVTAAAATAGATQRRREREKRRTASGMAEFANASTTASPVRGGSWGIAVDVEGMDMGADISIGAATNEVVNGSNRGNSGAGALASWKTRTSATNVATVGAAVAGVTGGSVRKTSRRRVGSYGSVVWAK